jgi:archaellum component FlaD/FlaE
MEMAGNGDDSRMEGAGSNLPAVLLARARAIVSKSSEEDKEEENEQHAEEEDEKIRQQEENSDDSDSEHEEEDDDDDEVEERVKKTAASASAGVAKAPKTEQVLGKLSFFNNTITGERERNREEKAGKFAVGLEAVLSRSVGGLLKGKKEQKSMWAHAGNSMVGLHSEMRPEGELVYIYICIYAYVYLYL